MNRDEIIKYLKKVSLFEGLPDEVFVTLADRVTERSLAKDEVLFHQGDPGDAVFVIRLGWVKLVVKDSQGTELVLNQLGPGEFLGEMSILDEEPRVAGVVALSPVKMFRLAHADFKAVVDQNPRLGMVLASNLSRRLRFNIIYLQNAMEWSYQVARGDYSFVMNELESVHATIVDTRKPDQARAKEMLAAFIEMVQGVKEREDALKQQLKHFTIELDKEKKQEDVDDITEQTFFRRLQSARNRRRRPSEEAD